MDKYTISDPFNSLSTHKYQYIGNWIFIMTCKNGHLIDKKITEYTHKVYQVNEIM